MVDEKLIKTVQTTFSIYGLILSRSLSISLAKQLLQINEDERDEWLSSIIEQILSQNLTDPHVTIEHIKIAIKNVMRADTLEETETKLNIINVFEVPKVKYDLCKKKFVLETITKDLYPDADYKSNLFKDRFEIIWYRVLRHELFSPPKFGEKNAVKIELTPIDALLSESKTGNVCVIGFLVEYSEKQYYLEDTSGAVKIDLRQAVFRDGLITEGSIVLVNGDYEDGVLTVEELGYPPPEPSANSRADFGDANTFGGPHPTSLKLSEKMKTHEDSNPDGMLIFVSDLWLDNSNVIDKFGRMLQGFADIPPIAFVLCGNFLSFTPNASSVEKLKDGFKRLAEIIARFSKIKESSKFIFVPGPADLGTSKILPRKGLPKYIVQDFLQIIPNAVLATNPCRIQYCTKEIVVYREDIVIKMCRNTLRFPEEETKFFKHYAKSIICQSHLAPMTLTMSPVYWKHDHALQLHPTPDLIVVADQYEPYSTIYSNCHIVNPGSFPKNNFSFKTFVPESNIIEDCEIPS